MPKPKTGVPREPTAAVQSVLDALVELCEQRGLTQKEMMKGAGTTQQRWSRWVNGAAPTLTALARVADALDADLKVEVVDRRRARIVPRDVLQATSQQAVEAAHYVDEHEEEDRERLVVQIKRLSEHLTAVRARKPAVKAK